MRIWIIRILLALVFYSVAEAGRYGAMKDAFKLGHTIGKGMGKAWSHFRVSALKSGLCLSTFHCNPAVILPKLALSGK